MKFLSLEPFVPSGSNFEGSKKLFQELGFKINWDAGDYVGFERDGCKFILQKFDNVEFAQNFMISVGISSAEEFWNELNEKQLEKKFAVKVGKPTQQPYGKEVNVIDIAGVCWHFVES
jgi:predicted lactoylglutathione lyase